jgi:uncharacterized membrane protein
MLKKTLTIPLSILGISFIVYFNIALYNFTEPLYYLVLFCSLVGAYSIIKGLETNPQ